MQIRRRWLDRDSTMPAFQRLDWLGRKVDCKDSNYWLFDVDIDRLVTVVRNLFTVAIRFLRCRRFRLAMSLWRATTFRTRQHEKLFARDATAPDKGSQQQQRKKRTGKSASHGSTSKVTSFEAVGSGVLEITPSLSRSSYHPIRNKNHSHVATTE